MLRPPLAVILGLCTLATASAQITLPPGYYVASVTPSGALGIPANLGGIEFSADGSTLYVGGSANAPSGAIYAVPVTRDPNTLYVTGLGPATFYASAPYIDGGLQFGPAGTVFFTGYPVNTLGQITGGTTTSLPLPPETTSVGGLVFVPAGLPNAGDLIVSSYNGGSFHTVALTDNGNGTWTPTTAALFATLPFGSEALRYIPSGPQAGDIIFTNYSIGNVSILDIDPVTGLPVGGAASPSLTTFATGIGGAEGFAFDPLTNDFFVSTYGGNPGNSIIRISGFIAPQFPLVPSSLTVPTSGGQIQYTLAAGSNAALRDYILLGGASGSTPGIMIGYINFPLNIDLFTQMMYPLINGPAFANFSGTTDLNGDATATLFVPPIPPGWVGATVTFAAGLVNPFNAASVAVDLTIVP